MKQWRRFFFHFYTAMKVPLFYRILEWFLLHWLLTFIRIEAYLGLDLVKLKKRLQNNIWRPFLKFLEVFQVAWVSAKQLKNCVCILLSKSSKVDDISDGWVVCTVKFFCTSQNIPSGLEIVPFLMSSKPFCVYLKCLEMSNCLFSCSHQKMSWLRGPIFDFSPRSLTLFYWNYFRNPRKISLCGKITKSWWFIQTFRANEEKEGVGQIGHYLLLKINWDIQQLLVGVSTHVQVVNFSLHTSMLWKHKHSIFSNFCIRTLEWIKSNNFFSGFVWRIS